MREQVEQGIPNTRYFLKAVHLVPKHVGGVFDIILKKAEFRVSFDVIDK